MIKYYQYCKDNGVNYTCSDTEGVIITSIGHLDLNDKVMILVLADTDDRLEEILNIATSFE